MRDAERGKEFEFLTNQLKFAASTIAKIYRDRWQIETFSGPEAVSAGQDIRGHQCQRFKDADLDALIAMLILKYLKLKSSFDWSLSNLVALLRQQLFAYRDCGSGWIVP